MKKFSFTSPFSPNFGINIPNEFHAYFKDLPKEMVTKVPILRTNPRFWYEKKFTGEFQRPPVLKANYVTLKSVNASGKPCLWGHMELRGAGGFKNSKAILQFSVTSMSHQFDFTKLGLSPTGIAVSPVY